MERTKLKLVRRSTSLIGEMKCLEQTFKQKGICFSRRRCVCVHAFLTNSHILLFIFLMTEKGMFALHIPDSQILPPQRNDWGKVKKEMSKERRTTGGGISQLNISGTFPSLSPLSIYIKTRLSIKVCRKPHRTRNHTATLTGMPWNY